MIKRVLLLLSLLASLSIFLQANDASADIIRNYPAKIDGYAAPDPATLAVRFHVYNNGTKSVSPNCTISVQDNSSAYHGFDVFYMKPIPAGTTVNSLGDIIVTGNGAKYVTQVKISCTASTSDTGIIAASTVRITKVDPPTTDGFAGHDSSGWFWGAIINVSGVPNSSVVKCTERPVSSSGKILVTYTFNGTVSGNAVGGSLQNTTASIGSQIKGVHAACVLGKGNISIPVPQSALSSGEPSQSSTPSQQIWYPKGYQLAQNGIAWKWLDQKSKCPTNVGWKLCDQASIIVKDGCVNKFTATISVVMSNTRKESDLITKSIDHPAPLQKSLLTFGTSKVTDQSYDFTIKKLSCS